MLDKLGNPQKLGAIDDAPVVHWVQQLLEQAVTLKASDLHFEPYEHHYRCACASTANCAKLQHRPWR